MARFNAGGIAQLRQEDITGGLQDSLLALSDRRIARQDRASQALDAYRPIAEQQDVDKAVLEAKEAVKMNQINDQYKRLQLDQTYQQDLKALDDQYAIANEKKVITYDQDGNVNTNTPEAIAYRKAQTAFNEKYKQYNDQYDTELQKANANALGALESDYYDPTALSKEVQNRLAGTGISQERSLKEGVLAATPYQAAALTERQKIDLEARNKGLEITHKAELDAYAELMKRKRTYQMLGKGASVSSGGYSGKPPVLKTKEYEINRDRIMDGVSSTSLFYNYKDNKDVVDDILSPLYKKYGGVMSSTQITDYIMSFNKDGILFNHLPADTTAKDVEAVIDDALAQKTALLHNNVLESGQDPITMEQYARLRDGSDARYKKGLSDTRAMFNTQPSGSKDMLELTARVNRLNSLTTEKPKTKNNPKSKGGSTGKSFSNTKAPTITKAMTTKQKKGDRSMLVESMFADPDKFSKEYQALNSKQQSRVDKVLGTAKNQKDMEALSSEMADKYKPLQDTQEKKDLEESLTYKRVDRRNRKVNPSLWNTFIDYQTNKKRYGKMRQRNGRGPRAPRPTQLQIQEDRDAKAVKDRKDILNEQSTAIATDEVLGLTKKPSKFQNNDLIDEKFKTRIKRSMSRSKAIKAVLTEILGIKEGDIPSAKDYRQARKIVRDIQNSK